MIRITVTKYGAINYVVSSSDPGRQEYTISKSDPGLAATHALDLAKGHDSYVILDPKNVMDLIPEPVRSK